MLLRKALLQGLIFLVIRVVTNVTEIFLLPEPRSCGFTSALLSECCEVTQKSQFIRV